MHITNIIDGTLVRTVEQLTRAGETVHMAVSFGRSLPDASIAFANGEIVSAELGDLQGPELFDFLICQERAITEINVCKTRAQAVAKSRCEDVAALLHQASSNVERCEARPLIYSGLPVSTTNEQLLLIFREFHQHARIFVRIHSEEDIRAPLPQCALLYAALASGRIRYTVPLVPLKTLRPLFLLIQPLEETEEANLRAYLDSLLPNPRATHIVIERFYAFASALESIAYRRSSDCGDTARKIIYKIVLGHKDDGGDPGGALVPVVPKGGPSSGGALAELDFSESFDWNDLFRPERS